MTLPDLDDAFELAAADDLTPERFAALPAPWLPSGRFTLLFPFGDHRTFRVRLEKHGPHRWNRTLALLIGPDNSEDFETQGLVTAEGFQLWKRFARGKHADHAALLWELARGEVIEGYELMIERKCRACSRPLTDPISIKTQVGPDCRKRLGISSSHSWSAG